MANGSGKGIAAVIALAAVAAVALIAYNYIGGRDTGELALRETAVVGEYPPELHLVLFADPSAGVFAATKDELRLVGFDGVEKYAAVLNLTAPVMVGRGATVGVSEQGGGLYYCFGDGGERYTKAYQDEILHFAVNSAGYSSVFTKHGEIYKHYTYNPYGIELRVGTVEEPGAYPVVSALSRDGRLLAISVAQTETTLNGVILFHETGESVYTNGLFGAYLNNPDQIFSRLEFFENHLVAVSDRQIVCFSLDNVKEPLWTKPLHNKLLSVGFNTGKNPGIAVAYGEERLNEAGIPNGTIEYYDLAGDRLWSYRAQREIKLMSAGSGGALVLDGATVAALDEKGQVIWSYVAEGEITSAFFGKTKNDALLATASRARLYRAEKTDERKEAE